MNLYESITKNCPFGLEMSFNDSGFTYITHLAYETASLAQYWQQMRDGTANIKHGAPPVDSVPLWTTDKWSIFKDPLAYEITVDFNDIKKSKDFSDHGLYIIYSPWTSTTISGNTVLVDLAKGNNNEDDPTDDLNTTADLKPAMLGKSMTDRRPRMPYTNIYALTTSHKMNPFDYTWHHNQAVSRMISICVPFADSPFSDWNLIFKMEDAGLLKINTGETTTLMPGQLGNTFLDKSYPKVWFNTKTATVTPDGYVDISFYLGDSSGTTITGHDADVYLDTTAGVLNKQKVTTQNGVGTVRLIASHLTSGEIAKVKCGFKFYTGTDDCVVTVQ